MLVCSCEDYKLLLFSRIGTGLHEYGGSQDTPGAAACPVVALSTGHFAQGTPSNEVAVMSADGHGKIGVDTLLAGHSAPPACIAELPIGVLASAPGPNGGVMLWGMGGTWPHLACIPPHGCITTPLAAMQGGLLATGGQERINIWCVDAEGGSTHVAAHNMPTMWTPSGMTALSSGSLAVTTLGEDNVLHTLDTQQGEWTTLPLCADHPGVPLELPGGRITGPSMRDGCLLVVDSRGCTPPMLLEGHLPPGFALGPVVTSCAVFEDGTVVSSGTMGNLRLWDAEKGVCLGVKAVPPCASMCVLRSHTLTSLRQTLQAAPAKARPHYIAMLQKASAAIGLRRTPLVLFRHAARHSKSSLSCPEAP